MEEDAPRVSSAGRGCFFRVGLGDWSVEESAGVWEIPKPARVLKGSPRRSGDPEMGPGAVTVVGELVLLPPVTVLIAGLCSPLLALELRSDCERVPTLMSGCVGPTGTVALRLALGVRRRREGSWTSKWAEAEGGYRPRSSLLLLALGALECPLCLLVGREVSSVRDLGLVAEMSDRCDRELALLLLPAW